MPPSLAAAPAMKPQAISRERMIFFMARVAPASMGTEGHAIGDRLEAAHLAPPGHQQEEAEIDQRAELRHIVADFRRRLRTEVAQHQEEEHEHAVDILVPARPVADRL